MRAYNSAGWGGFSSAWYFTTEPAPNQAPTCSLSAMPTSGNVPLTVTFTMSASDPDGLISVWGLDVNGDGSAEYLGAGNPPSTQTYTYTTPGTYSVALAVLDDDGANCWKAVTIVANVASNLPAIAFSPSSFSFTATKGGANPSSQALSIWNSGSGTLSWSASGDATWLSLSPASGSSTGEADNVTVSVSISGMSAGSYKGIITISAPGATNTPQTVPVTLTINPAGGDVTPPTVVSTSPRDGALNVAVDTVVTATFSEAMDSSTITISSFTLDGGAVSGTVTYDNLTYTATFTPDASLEYNHKYIATLSTAITDASGNPLAQPYIWSFTTQPASGDTFPPAKVTDLAISETTASSINLTWTAPGDDGNSGTASEYDIRYSTSLITEANWASATQCTGEPTPHLAGSTEFFNVTGLSSGITYYFALKSADEVPNRAELSNVVSGTTTTTPDTTPPTCVIQLREQGTTSQIDKVDLGEVFDIYVGNSTDNIGITKVCFSSDDSQDDSPTGEWTGWYDWNTSSGDWDAANKTVKWSFATPGIKEVWAEVKDNGSNNIGQCHADIFVHPGYAIIVAGQGKWKLTIDYCANNAYRVFRNLGFDDDHIFYLNSQPQPEIDGRNVVDDSALLSNFTNVVSEVRDRIRSNSTPLILYLVGHGLDDPDCFIFDDNANPEGYLRVSKLQEILGKFSSETPMLIVINSCYSGCFIESTEKSPNSVSAANRIVITSAPANHGRRLFSWVLFSNRFWKNLNKGFDVKRAFTEDATAEDVVFSRLDDNGDKVGHSPLWLNDDGELAGRTRIGIAGFTDLKLTPLLLIWKRSPGEIRVYDSQNRVTGVINGEVKEEIPNSTYDPEEEVVAVFCSSDMYHYQVVGTEEGAYRLDIVSIEDGNATAVAVVDVPTSPNTTHNYTVNWAALSQGEKSVTIEIDSDGDGIVDDTVFTTPPNVPGNPSPSDGATEVSLNTTLSWNASDPDGDNLTYYVYFGTDENLPLASDNQTELTYSPTSGYNTTYYWRIVARDSNGIAAESPIWSFSTCSEPSGGGRDDVSTPPAPANFVLSSLTISPTEVKIGEMVEISILVTNTGGESGSYEVVLKINGGVEATKVVTIVPAESKSVSFTTSKDIAGRYLVEVNGISGFFTVKEPVTEAGGFNWSRLGGIIAAFVIAFIIVCSMAGGQGNKP